MLDGIKQLQMVDFSRRKQNSVSITIPQKLEHLTHFLMTLFSIPQSTLLIQVKIGEPVPLKWTSCQLHISSGILWDFLLLFETFEEGSGTL